MEIALVIGLLAALLVCAWLVRERWRLAAEAELARARAADIEQARSSFQAIAGEALRHSNEEWSSARA